MNIDQKYIDYFEENLNPAEPEKSNLSFKILGYGEISSIFQMDEYKDIVFKRLPVFPDLKSAEIYREQYFQYTAYLKDAKINLPDDDVYITHISDGPYVLYLAQKYFNDDDLCNKLIHTFNQSQIAEMVGGIVESINNVREFNEKSMPKIEIAIDAQLSNWVYPMENGKRKLYLIDTSTPFYRVNSEEQLDVKLLLESMPFLIRLFVGLINLDDVVARYYDYRIVFIDIVGNLIKEQARDMIPFFIEMVNKSITADFNLNPISKKDVESYYKKDKMIWKVFSALRRMDRFVTTKIFRKRYEFLLPGKVKR